MVAGITYDQNSFLAGIAVGRQMKGWAAFGTMEGYDPEGDLILRPITQGVKTVTWKDRPFTVATFTDSVNEDSVFPTMDDEELIQVMGVTIFPENRFNLYAMAERLVIDEVIHAFSINEEINPLDYDDTIVYINSSGAYTMDSVTRTFTSTAQTVDVGTMQEVAVTLEDFLEVESQEVSV